MFICVLKSGLSLFFDDMVRDVNICSANDAYQMRLHKYQGRFVCIGNWLLFMKTFCVKSVFTT